jgi:hypothetical protein
MGRGFIDDGVGMKGVSGESRYKGTIGFGELN